MSTAACAAREGAAAWFSYARQMRRYFHMNPELAAEEYNTAAAIEHELDRAGLRHGRTAGTGVWADIHGTRPGDGLVVLRADIDALPVTELHECPYRSTVPGKMHACGHDAHAAALLAAARILTEHRDMFGGTVRLIFQPGEEICYGAKRVVAEGLVDAADRILGIHMASNVPVGQVVVMPGPNCASVDWFRISVQGRASHIASPEQGADAAWIASQILIGSQGLLTRRTNPMEQALIGIGKLQAGTTWNVVAPTAELEGTLRTFSGAVRARLQEQLGSLARQTARTWGGTASIEWQDYTALLSNDPAAAREVQQTAAALFGAEHVITSRNPSLGGDDFAEFLRCVPGVYAFVGSASPEIPESMVAHHDDHFDIDERALEVAAALYAGYAMDWLNRTCMTGDYII